MGSQPPASCVALDPLATLDPAALAGLPVSSPLTVRSAALSGHLLYLGTGGGKLLLFFLQDPSTPEFLSLLPIGATLPVFAIVPLRSVARVLVLALADGLLLLADPLLSRPVRHLGSLRSVAAVAARRVDHADPSSCSVAISVGKKLLRVNLTLRWWRSRQTAWSNRVFVFSARKEAHGTAARQRPRPLGHSPRWNASRRGSGRGGLLGDVLSGVVLLRVGLCLCVALLERAD